MMPVKEVPLTEDRKKMLSLFMEKTEYGPSEILAYSTTTGMVLTRNGGKYKLDGDKVEHLAGPSSDPSERI